MNALLIVIFIILFIYLLVHMCGGSGDGGVPGRPDRQFDKSLLVLDGLMLLDVRGLYRLKKDIVDLKALLDRGRKNSTEQISAVGQGTPPGIETGNSLSGEQTLKLINRGVKKHERRHLGSRGSSFSKSRIILVQIALVLIILKMVLF